MTQTVIDLTDEELEFLYSDNSDLQGWCGCYQAVGGQHVICAWHLKKITDKRNQSVASARGSIGGS